MQWIKQTFAARFNKQEGRTGYIWGDRYRSQVLEGAAAVDWEAVKAKAEAPTAADMRRKPGGVRPRQAGKEAEIPFLPEIPLRAASPPA